MAEAQEWRVSHCDAESNVWRRIPPAAIITLAD